MKVRFCKIWLLAVLTAGLSACGFRSNLPADLQHKLDSVKALEELRLLRLQGIDLDNPNPLRAFYDSLMIQPLPLRYSDDYVKLLPNFQPARAGGGTEP